MFVVFSILGTISIDFHDTEATISGDGSFTGFGKQSTYYLKTVTFTGNIYEIGSNAFYEIFSLRTVIFNITSPNFIIRDYAFYSCGFSQINLPDNTISIGEYAFSHTHLDSIEFPASLTEIKKSCFENCMELKKVNLKNIETIRNFAFYGCNSLSELILSDSIKTIGGSVFTKCDLITKLTIPPKVDELSSYTFNEMGGLQKLNLNHVKRLSEYSIHDCPKLNYIHFGDSLEFIDEKALQFIYLKEIILPPTLHNLSAKSFASCKPF